MQNNEGVFYLRNLNEGVFYLRSKNAGRKRPRSDHEIQPVKTLQIHYQFEAIHSFFDGNGRTGRIILLLYLKQCGLLDLPALYLSSYILKNKTDYYLNLRNVTEKGSWENWVLHMLDMIEVTSRESRTRIEHIAALMKEMGEEIQKSLPKIYWKCFSGYPIPKEVLWKMQDWGTSRQQETT